MPRFKLFLVFGLSVLFAGCSTIGSSDLQTSGNNPTDLGTKYLFGRGVPQSDSKAFYYFNQSAIEDDPFAQNEVAYMYAAGKGTPRDFRKAFKYYQKAADHGLASAQYSLGLMYEQGLGTLKNHALAVHWFERSASLGFGPASVALEKYR